jgi:hypothetical protein
MRKRQEGPGSHRTVFFSLAEEARLGDLQRLARSGEPTRQGTPAFDLVCKNILAVALVVV